MKCLPSSFLLFLHIKSFKGIQMWKSELCMRKTPCEGEINLFYFFFIFQKSVSLNILSLYIRFQRNENEMTYLKVLLGFNLCYANTCKLLLMDGI